MLEAGAQRYTSTTRLTAADHCTRAAAPVESVDRVIAAPARPRCGQKRRLRGTPRRSAILHPANRGWGGFIIKILFLREIKHIVNCGKLFRSCLHVSQDQQDGPDAPRPPKGVW